jgi:hypothetical protein
MDLHVYETPYGLVADFRPYLDGRDHSFDDHRELAGTDPRWEKIRSLLHPVRRLDIGGRMRWVGRATVKWRELMVFPLAWDQPFEPAES